MHYQTNRVNHDFQIAYFIAGACHTPDAAYAILCDLRENRSDALKMFEASKLREKAKRIKAERMLKSDDEVDQLEGEADLAEIKAMEETTARNVAAAQAELATIEDFMARLEPLRKYAHLPLPEAHEAAQAEEWKLELIHRAENYIFTVGHIPTDHFATMRMHPAFKNEILPAIRTFQRIAIAASNPNDEHAAVQAMDLVTAPKFELPKLLTNQAGETKTV